MIWRLKKEHFFIYERGQLIVLKSFLEINRLDLRFKTIK